ncbi:hypothetical protein [Luteipulveratus mongoliensis]|uniref:Uncharacterized protein n=1 Tax=Luteipulveratus mongoliensis TaxID=571913 RepID=A0A0K1JGE8_9MICO|nr:hypothetical protein [Luteipulveratus mongoliensis]AKU15771.1 hypothetical protein VV02_07745 [Luteipulveratus mongoliensis]
MDTARYIEDVLSNVQDVLRGTRRNHPVERIGRIGKDDNGIAVAVARETTVRPDGSGLASRKTLGINVTTRRPDGKYTYRLDQASAVKLRDLLTDAIAKADPRRDFDNTEKEAD